MKRGVLIFAITAVVLVLWAAPTTMGSRGLATVLDAGNDGSGKWTAGLSFSGPEHGAPHMFDWDIRTWENAVFRILGSWVPLEALEVSAALGLGYDYQLISVGSSPTIGLWDFTLAAKYTLPLEFWDIGFDGRAFLPVRSGAFGPPVFGGAVRLLATNRWEMINTHLNIGGMFAEKMGAILGIGTELQYRFFNPYIELTGEIYPDSFPLRVTPGLRFVTDFGISVYYAADFGLTPDGRSINTEGREYVNQVSAGISYTPTMREARRTSHFIVSVRDAVTGEPMSAQIEIEGHYPSVFMVSSAGNRMIEVQSGHYPVTVCAPGYLPETHIMRFSSLKSTSLDVELEPDRTGSHLIIRTLDRSTGAVIPHANVALDGTSVACDTRGEARFSLPPGTYSIAVTAPGYVSGEDRVSLSPGIPSAVDVRLSRVDTRITLTGIYFASGSAFLSPESYPVIDEAVLRLQVNPDTRIEIAGHTDAEGGAAANLALSQRRAEAVRDYIVRAHGISADRLVARGYGETRPVASNDTQAGRAQNRRVELLVIR